MLAPDPALGPGAENENVDAVGIGAVAVAETGNMVEAKPMAIAGVWAEAGAKAGAITVALP